MESIELNWLDYTIIGIVLLSTFVGIVRGLLKEVLPLVSLVLALLISYRVGPGLQPYVLDWLKHTTVAYVFCFVVVFIIAWMILGLIGSLLGKLVKATAAGPLDKLFGGILGVVRGIAVAVILVVALLAFLPPDSSALRESALAPKTLYVGRLAISLMPSDTKEDLRGRLKDLWDKAGKIRRGSERHHPESV